MKRFQYVICLTFVMSGFAGCGGGNQIGDVVGDVPDEDRIVELDVTYDEGQPDEGRDIGRDEGEPGDSVDDRFVDDSDVNGDIDDIDGGDESGADTPETDGCPGETCEPCPDDGLFCTEEYRDSLGECQVRVKPEFCMIGGECLFENQPSPDDMCLACRPAVSGSEYSPAEGMPCDDADPCTAGDTCDADGICQPGAGFGCDDDNECTIDRCDPNFGCTNTPRASTCDDHDSCTYQDQCNVQTGVCKGFPVNCNDGNECTRDYCDSFDGCQHEPISKACNDFDGCTLNDMCNEDGVCQGTSMDCSDGIECTVDSCMSGVCLNDWHYGPCNDGDMCTDNDSCNGYHECAGIPKTSCDDYNVCTTDYCDPAVGCVNEFNTVECEPDSACEINGVCAGGVCVGQPRNCDKGNPCMIYSCNPDTGCKEIPTTGVCDDHNACTINENCSTGACIPPEGPAGVTNCDDLNDCTVDNCVPAVGCVHTPQEGECQDPNPCSLTGTGFCRNGECISNVRDCDDNQPCTLDTCDGAGNCIHPPISGFCDDGNHCTFDEVCIGGDCIEGKKVDCNDSNVCTLDECNPDYGCVYTPTGGSCSDGDVCTINDGCANGTCVGTVRACEDYNVCTDNGCNKTSGCFFTPNSVECDDFNICTFDDICGAGECHGVSVFEDPATKAATLTYGVNGNLGQGVDVDDDPSTCAPKGSCVQGIDNAFSRLHWLFNTEMLNASSDGSWSLLLEHDGLKVNGTAYNLNLYWGARIDPVTCDPTTSGCNYGVYTSSLSPTCGPLDVFDNAVINGTKLKAGGATYEVPVSIVFGDTRRELVLYRAKVTANVSLAGGKVVGGAGALGGAFVVQQLVEALESMPESAFLPRYNKEIILAYIDIYLKPDIDLDGDGTDESVSVGMPFSIVTGHLIGPI
ncbi:MAG TPA: hypothetical protein PLC24_05935 [Myxococcota bacterium]|nr:hypothetical protein [Myxococcota bacterium]